MGRQPTPLGRPAEIPSVSVINENHARLCPSPEWAAHLHNEILPALTRHADLGTEMLEVGPGPGAAAAWLVQRVRHLTVIEADEDAAAALAARYPEAGLTVLAGDAAALDLPDESFDSVGCFTMLHHVPTTAGQNAILAHALRVLRPGGALIGSDSLPSDGLHHFHAGDTYNPVEPVAMLARLQTLGFGKITIMVDGSLLFVARKPGADGDHGTSLGERTGVAA